VIFDEQYTAILYSVLASLSSVRLYICRAYWMYCDYKAYGKTFTLVISLCLEPRHAKFQ